MPGEKRNENMIRQTRSFWSMAFRKCLLVPGLVCLAFINVSASTLSTNYADVEVENLLAGGTYDLTEHTQCPMWIGYNGHSETIVRVSIEAPSPTDLKKGYEPIPDTSWVTLSDTEAVLQQGKSATIDVTVAIPNDSKYLGRKFQAWIRVASVPSASNGGVAVSLALKGRISFSVAGKQPTAAELEQLRNNASLNKQGISITPESFAVQMPSDSRRVDVTGKTPLKCINSSDEKCTVTFTAVNPSSHGIPVPLGYTAGDPKDFTLKNKKISVAPGAEKDTKIFVTVKNKDAKKLFYVVKAEINSKSLQVAKYIQVNVALN